MVVVGAEPGAGRWGRGDPGGPRGPPAASRDLLGPPPGPHPGSGPRASGPGPRARAPGLGPQAPGPGPGVKMRPGVILGIISNFFNDFPESRGLGGPLPPPPGLKNSWGVVSPGRRCSSVGL